MRTLDLLNSNAHRFAGFPHFLMVFEPAQPDFRTLEVSQNPDGAAGFVGSLPNPLVVPFVVCVNAV